MSRKKKIKKKSSNFLPTRKLITFTDPKSFISEQFRTIRTNINFTLPDIKTKKILITSSIPGEGKSTIAANLGIVFAQEGKRVLIVDADMRKPTMHYTFNFFNITGLSNLLSKEKELQDVIQDTFIYKLSIMPSGPIPPNPSELLSSSNLDSLISAVDEYFDIVIFDAPPLLSVTDAQILSNKCDGTILVVGTGYVEKPLVQKAKSILMASRANIVGVILNYYEIPQNGDYNYYY